MAIDTQALVQQMWAAAKGPLGNAANAAEPFAKAQFANIAQTVVSIEQGVAQSQLTQVQSRYLLELQKQATTSALLAEEGLGILAAEAALNAALSAVTTLVNTAVGFALL